MVDVIRSIKDGKGYKVGPQNGRKGSMGIEGKTSLFEKPPGPNCRDLDKLKAEAAKAAAEKK